MPIWLRTFTLQKIQEFYDKEREQSEQASGNQTLTPNSPLRPNIKTPPSYTSKRKAAK